MTFPVLPGRPQVLSALLRTYSHLSRTQRALLSLLTVLGLAAGPSLVFAADSGGNEPQPATHSDAQQAPRPAASADTPAAPQTAPSAAVSGNASNSSSTTTHVSVNGKAVPIPENGSLDTTITNGQTSTDLHVEHHSSSTQSSGGSSSHSSTSVHSSSGGSSNADVSVDQETSN